MEDPMLSTRLPDAVLTVVLALVVAVVPTFGEDTAGSGAATTGNVEVPTDDLAILVKPLTADELLVEADAWLDLLRTKQEEISSARIAAKARSPEVDRSRNATPSEETQNTTPSPETEPDGSAKEKSAGELEATTDLLHVLNTLKEQRTGLIDRLRVVLDELELKGGDATSHRTYVAAISGGLEVDVADAGAVWIALTGWIRRADGGLRWGKNLASFLGLLMVFWLLSRITARVVTRALEAVERLSTLLRGFIVKTATRLVFIVGVIVAVSSLGVDIGPLLAVIGAAGFVVAFALQGTLSNFASGLLILLYRPFDVGDSVEIADVTGKVIELNLVSTRIHTSDNKVLYVPNNAVWNNTITNITGSPTRRVDMVFGIGYGDDVGKALRILEELVKGHEKVLDDPGPTIRVHELAASSVNIICRPWARTEDYWGIFWDLQKEVKERFDAEGISIPFPQQDVHLHGKE